MSERTSGRARRLLLVDDEARILSSLRRALRREGYEVHTAESPDEALRALDAGSFDLILADYRMPGMTGVEFLARAAERWPDAVRILLTGWSEQVPRAALEAAGVRALLEKPWDPEALKRVIRDSVGP
ncbi:MAG: response regulator [Deltaproteobacteria bacterium]|nr:MAG: response regulator [Deltaproteobacteria bacterium]